MAQSGYTPILIYGSGTASNIPSAANLTSSANGAELALNYADGKLYYKNSAGTVTLLADKISVSVASANGFAGSVSQATATSTPAITLSTSVTGVLVGNGTAVAAAVSGTDFKTINSTSILGSGNISITSTPGGSTTQVQYNNAGVFAGSANFVFDGTNVGIGTSSPATKLDVTGTIHSTVGLVIGAAIDGTTGGFSRSGGDTYLDYAGSLRFRSGAASERVTLDSSGNLGIGTSSPSTLGGGGLTLGTTSAGKNLIVYSSADGSNGVVQFIDLNAANAFQINGNSANIGLYGYGSRPMIFYTNGTERVRISTAGGFSAGTTADPGAGAIYATGAITAYYSDARLKDVKGTITDALDKVSSLSGVYYTNNEVAVAHGYTSAETQVGLLAQDVEAVLPEVVKAAPFDLDEKGNSKSGEHYKTIQYERIIPLLVEAIKELRAEIQALRG